MSNILSFYLMCVLRCCNIVHTHRCTCTQYQVSHPQRIWNMCFCQKSSLPGRILKILLKSIKTAFIFGLFDESPSLNMRTLHNFVNNNQKPRFSFYKFLWGIFDSCSISLFVSLNVPILFALYMVKSLHENLLIKKILFNFDSSNYIDKAKSLATFSAEKY